MNTNKKNLLIEEIENILKNKVEPIIDNPIIVFDNNKEPFGMIEAEKAELYADFWLNEEEENANKTMHTMQ